MLHQKLTVREINVLWGDVLFCYLRNSTEEYSESSLKDYNKAFSLKKLTALPEYIFYEVQVWPSRNLLNWTAIHKFKFNSSYLNGFHKFFWAFRSWLWTSKCWLSRTWAGIFPQVRVIINQPLNIFAKKLHRRYSTGFWIRLWFKVNLHRKIKCIRLFCICNFQMNFIYFALLFIGVPPASVFLINL